jgi:hypothetical protein
MKQLGDTCVLSSAVIFETMAPFLSGSVSLGGADLTDMQRSRLDVSAGSGITNFAFPDTASTYWLMPVDTTRWNVVVQDPL